MEQRAAAEKKATDTKGKEKAENEGARKAKEEEKGLRTFLILIS